MDDRLAARLAEADLVLAVGGRLGDVPTRRYTLLEPPNPSATLVHVHPDPRELGFVFEPDLPTVSSLPDFAAALAALAPVEPRWREWASAARAEYEDSRRHDPLEVPVELGVCMPFLPGLRPGDSLRRDA